MSDFWSRKLGGAAPQQPQGEPQSHAPASSRPWWDQSAPVPQQGSVTAAHPGFGAGQNYPQQQQQPGDLSPEAIDHHTKHATLARNHKGHCPKCGGPNYVAIGKQFFQSVGTVEQRRCFDCGYPVDNRESGTPVSIAKGDAQHARQVEHGGVVPNFSGQQVQAPAFAAEQGGPGR